MKGLRQPGQKKEWESLSADFTMPACRCAGDLQSAVAVPRRCKLVKKYRVGADADQEGRHALGDIRVCAQGPGSG